MIRFLVLALVLCTALPAHAQLEPVELTVDGLFGPELLIPQRHIPIRIQTRNRTSSPIRGEIVVSSADWQSRPERHRVELDLPARGERATQLTVYARDGGSLTVDFEIDGRRAARQYVSLSYDGARSGVVVLADPPRVRGSLLDLQANQPQPYGGTRMVNVPIGVVGFDAQSGDPLAPLDVMGWNPVGLVVASAPTLERLTPPQRAALEAWIRGGGELLVFPRTPEDLRAPFLDSLVDLEWQEGVAVRDHFAFVPEGARGPGLVGADTPRGHRARPEGYGASTAYGFGRVHVATYDGTAPPYHDAPEVRRIVGSILGVPHTRGVEKPLFALGDSEAQVDEWTGNWMFQPLRSVLDPNESFRPALGLVAIVLLLYVIFVGPVSFSWIAKKNRPTLALVTTPVAATACLLLLLGVGYVGKGTTMRYRAVSLMEVSEGERLAMERRYLGLFLTRPTSFELDGPDTGSLRLLRESANRTVDVHHDGDHQVLRGLQGGLWETIFLRQEEEVDLGGSIVFERGDAHLVAVRNESRVTLHGAFVLDAAGNLYRVGEIAPGARVEIASSPGLSLGGDNPTFYSETDPELRSVANELGLPPEDRKAIFGLTQVAGGALATAYPALYARIDPSGPAMIGGLFVRETEVRLVRVVPYIEGQPVHAKWDADSRPVEEEGYR
ncbi:MAG: hypothetical protein H6722_05265 [Sandaracinus sp.]|nr:hypothetical protein [Sandaracinus sp.]